MPTTATDDRTETESRTFEKPPQERSTEVIFENVTPTVRATADDDGVLFESKHLHDDRYSHALSAEGRAGVVELRNYLNRWLDGHDDGAGGDA